MLSKMSVSTCADGLGTHSTLKWRMKRSVSSERPPPGGAAEQQMVESITSLKNHFSIHSVFTVFMLSIHSVSTGPSKTSQWRSSDVSRIDWRISDDASPSVHSCVSRFISPYSSPIEMALGFRMYRFTFWKRSSLCCASSRRYVMASASTA